MSNIIITGAGTGMGLSMTKKFLANDWHVIMAVRNAAKAKKVYQELQDQYGDQVACTRSTSAMAKPWLNLLSR